MLQCAEVRARSGVRPVGVRYAATMISVRRAALPVALALACVRSEPSAPTLPPASAPVPPPASATAIADPVGVAPEMLRTSLLEPGDPEAKCSSNGYHLARCLQARAHPQVAFHWDLYWDEYETDEHGNGTTPSPSQLRARRDRVIARLRADGATQILDSTSPASVWVIAPYPAVRGALALPDVQHATVSCDPEDREFCACERLRVDQCPEHAFCQPVRGQPEDLAGRCMAPQALAGCTRAEGCSDAMTRAAGPDGRRWLFPSGCRPDQPGWRGLGYRIDLPPLPPDCAGP